jgi:hypothetical protein
MKKAFFSTKYPSLRGTRYKKICIKRYIMWNEIFKDFIFNYKIIYINIFTILLSNLIL